jgi:hypothetical protein
MLVLNPSGFGGSIVMTGSLLSAATRIVLAAFGILMLLLMPSNAQTCGLKLLASYPMQDDPIGRLVVPMTVEHTTQNLIIDTGAFANMLTIDTVNALKLPKFEMAGIAYSTQGRMTHYSTAELDIGALHSTGIKFLETEGIPGWKKTGVAGVLGADVLTRLDLDLDFGSKKANLMLQDHCPGQVVYWSRAYGVVPMDLDDNGHIKVLVTVNGVEMKAQIDTGSTGSTLSTEAVALLPKSDASGSSDVQPHPVYTLTFGSVTVQNARLEVVEDKIGKHFQADEAMSGPIGERIRIPNVLLGNDILSKLHLYIAYKEKKIYVTAADAH